MRIIINNTVLLSRVSRSLSPMTWLFKQSLLLLNSYLLKLPLVNGFLEIHFWDSKSNPSFPGAAELAHLLDQLSYWWSLAIRCISGCFISHALSSSSSLFLSFSLLSSPILLQSHDRLLLSVSLSLLFDRWIVLFISSSATPTASLLPFFPLFHASLSLSFAFWLDFDLFFSFLFFGLCPTLLDRGANLQSTFPVLDGSLSDLAIPSTSFFSFHTCSSLSR